MLAPLIPPGTHHSTRLGTPDQSVHCDGLLRGSSASASYGIASTPCRRPSAGMTQHHPYLCTWCLACLLGLLISRQGCQRVIVLGSLAHICCEQGVRGIRLFLLLPGLLLLLGLQGHCRCLRILRMHVSCESQAPAEVSLLIHRPSSFQCCELGDIAHLQADILSDTES